MPARPASRSRRGSGGWNWPIAYLATPQPTVSVRLDSDADPASGAETPARGTARFFVEFAGTPELAATLRRLEETGRRVTSTTIADAGGRDHLVIVEVAMDRPECAGG